MRRVIVISAISLAIVTVAVVVYNHNAPHSLELPLTAAAPSSSALKTEAAASERLQSSATSRVAVDAKPHAKTIAQMRKDAKDYFAFAKSILPKAQSGDPAAQFALWQVHQVCYDTDARAMVDNGQGRAMSWDDAIQRASALHVPIDKAKQQWDLCQGLFSDDASVLGDPWQWLQRATDQGYPEAQVATAQARLQQDVLKATQKGNGAVITGYALLPPIGGPDAKPSELVSAAIKSLDPEAIADAAAMINMFNPRASAAERQLTFAAWTYVACIRGADCSSFGEPDKSYCDAADSNCIGVPKQLLEMTHNNWDALHARADEINAALNAKDWAKLGLGS